MEEERRGGAADVKLMSLDSYDAAQQQDWVQCEGGALNQAQVVGQQWSRPHHRYYIMSGAHTHTHTHSCAAQGAVCTNVSTSKLSVTVSIVCCNANNKTLLI